MALNANDLVSLLQKQNLVSNNTATVLNKYLRYDSSPSKLPPTSGKNIDENNKYNKHYIDLNALKQEQAVLQEKIRVRLDERAKVLNQNALTIEDTLAQNTLINQTKATSRNFKFLNSAIDEVLDPILISKTSIAHMKDVINKDDTGEYGVILNEYFVELEKIAAKVKPIKDKISEENKHKQIISSQNQLAIYDYPDRVMDKWVYDFEMYYIRPDNVKVYVDKYITELVYTIDYDTFVTPVYSMRMKISTDVFSDFRYDFEALNFYLSVKAARKTDGGTIEINKRQVLNNHAVICINPLLPSEGDLDSDKAMRGLPIHEVKLDFISKRDAKLNMKIQSKVFQNVTMLDVIAAILSEAYDHQVNVDTTTAELIKYTIAPPDNITRYEQVILDPGTISYNIKQLQEKYGVYNTGIRVLFDTQTMEIDPNTKKTKVQSVISVLSKGSIVELTNALSTAVIEILDRNHLKTTTFYESGSNVIGNVILARTQEPYIIDKKNAAKLIHGDSVRVIGSSQNSTHLSECDIDISDSSTQRIYWNNNDNPYALTQLQDSIREQELNVTIQLNDVDIYSFHQNLMYVLRFYNGDDPVYSGQYRLKGFQFRFAVSNISILENIPVVSYLNFMTIPKVTVNGSLVPKESYASKVDNFMNNMTYFVGKPYAAAKTGTKSPVSPNIPSSTKTSGAFNPDFFGQSDYLGQVVPREITDSYKMSRHITLGDTYKITCGTFPQRAHAMCSNVDIFNFAQKFSSRILDPIIDKYGKFVGGGGKMNSFYRYDIPSGGSKTSMHLWALAADIIPSTGIGDSLCDVFYWIVKQSGIEFDQCILEGHSSEWRWIHIGMNCNCENTRRVLLSPNAGQSYINVNVNAWTKPEDAHFAVYRGIIR